ncbi:MAG: hypothetical protein ABI120_13500 [Gemmatimonadaceae bacterium]
MKRTIQVVSAALLLTVASVTAQAQGGGGGGRGGRGWEAQKTMLLKDITLSPAVASSVDSIAKVYTDKQMEMRAGMAQGAQMTDEQRAKMMAITPERNAAIKKLLTADQATQFDKNVAEMPQGRGRGNS